MSGGLVTLLVILLIVVLLVVWAFGMYNGLVRMRNQVQESWNQVDVELQRRYDLIPNLVEAVKGYAGHERNTLEEVIRLRNQAASMAGGGHQLPTADRAQVEEQLSRAVNNLLVTVEAYPNLKSDQSFRELQNALTETEDRIAAGRRYYNANVRAYNTKVESVPTNMVAKFGKFEKANYFEVTNQEVRQSQRIDFGTMSQVGPTGSQREAQAAGQGQIPAQTYQSAYPNSAPVDPGQTGPWGNQQQSQPSQPQYAEPPRAIEPQGQIGSAQPANFGQPPAYGQSPQADPYGNPVPRTDPYGNPVPPQQQQPYQAPGYNDQH